MWIPKESPTDVTEILDTLCTEVDNCREEGPNDSCKGCIFRTDKTSKKEQFKNLQTYLAHVKLTK